MPTLCMTDLIGFRSSLEENEPHKKMKNSVSKWHLSTALTNPIIRFSLMNEMSIQDPSRDYRFLYQYRFCYCVHVTDPNKKLKHSFTSLSG